jgi:glutathione S-transferase
MIHAVDVATSLFATVARLGAGTTVVALGPRPDKPLELYDFEGCPFCRKVREALSMLDLDALVYPCPKKGPRFRPQAARRGGKAQFPFLVDPNHGVELYESDEIIRYLFDRYGAGTGVPWVLGTWLATDATSLLASAWRLGGGVSYRQAREPKAPLELWSYEGSPYCRIAREALCELELPYLVHNVAKGSPRRDAFVRRAGKMQVPYLVDPNTSAALFESAEIVRYLETTYAV